MKKRKLLWLGLLFCKLMPLSAQDLYLGNGATMMVGANQTLSVRGNLTLENTTGITGEGTVMLSGATAQTIAGSASALPALTLENAAGVTVSGNKSLSGQLTLNATVATVNSGSVLHVNQNAVSRTTGYVVGALAKTFTPTSLVKSFEVGDAGDYMPVQLTYASAAANFEVSAIAKSDALTSRPSSISATKYLDGHYTIANLNGAPGTYAAQFTFLPAQLLAGASAANLVAAVETAPGVFSNNVTQTAQTANSASFNLTNYGRVQLGESGAIVVNLKALLEGFYAGSGLMSPVLANSGIGSNTAISDTLTLELRSATSPFGVIATQKAALATNGNGVFTFNNVAPGNYYLVAKHRNHLATWSANTVACGASTNYDFTNAASKAYGDNMKQLATGVYGFYAGDINQDGFIDGTDFTDIDNDNFSGAFGYIATDLDGDGFTGGTDYSNLDNNNFNGVYYNAPIGATYSIRRNSSNTQIIKIQKSK